MIIMIITYNLNSHGYTFPSKSHGHSSNRKPQHIEYSSVCKIKYDRQGLVVVGCWNGMCRVDKHAIVSQHGFELLLQGFTHAAEFLLVLWSVSEFLPNAKANGRECVTPTTGQPIQELLPRVNRVTLVPHQGAEGVVATGAHLGGPNVEGPPQRVNVSSTNDGSKLSKVGHSLEDKEIQ